MADKVDRLRAVIDHFRHITESFAPGLFHCYDVSELPRTNNDLEQCFGLACYYERRATRQRGAIPGLIVHSSVCVLATMVTKRHPLQGADL